MLSKFNIGNLVRVRAEYPILGWNRRGEVALVVSVESPDGGRTIQYDIVSDTLRFRVYEREIEFFNEEQEAVKLLGEDYFA